MKRTGMGLGVCRLGETYGANSSGLGMEGSSNSRQVPAIVRLLVLCMTPLASVALSCARYGDILVGMTKPEVYAMTETTTLAAVLLPLLPGRAV